jgi:hypothetical protein
MSHLGLHRLCRSPNVFDGSPHEIEVVEHERGSCGVVVIEYGPKDGGNRSGALTALGKCAELHALGLALMRALRRDALSLYLGRALVTRRTHPHTDSDVFGATGRKSEFTVALHGTFLIIP